MVSGTDPRALSRRRHTLAVARAATAMLVVLGLHWVNEFSHWYFLLLGLAALALLASGRRAIQGLGVLAALGRSDRLAFWIVLSVCAIAGYLHNRNNWTPDGFFNRAGDLALWKAELILSISVAAPLVRWLVGLLAPRMLPMDGARFANEFSLYVNFSGIALLIWAGDPVVSLTTLGSLLALLVLVELTLAASG